MLISVNNLNLITFTICNFVVDNGIYITQLLQNNYVYTGVLNWRYDAIHGARECQRASIFFPAPL